MWLIDIILIFLIFYYFIKYFTKLRGLLKPQKNKVAFLAKATVVSMVIGIVLTD